MFFFSRRAERPATLTRSCTVAVVRGAGQAAVVVADRPLWRSLPSPPPRADRPGLCGARCRRSSTLLFLVSCLIYVLRYIPNIIINAKMCQSILMPHFKKNHEQSQGDNLVNYKKKTSSKSQCKSNVVCYGPSHFAFLHSRFTTGREEASL